jgi:hypothetical protein
MSSEGTDPTVEELAERIEQLEETQQELKQGAVDSQGRTWTLGSLLGIGLTRRQAIQAIGAIAAGVAAPVAISKSVEADPGDNGRTTWGGPNNRFDAWLGEADAESISTDKGDITNESFIAGYLDTIKTGVSSNDFVNVVDSEEEDVLDEFNSSYEFTPSTTGWYDVTVFCRPSSMTSGDSVQLGLRNTSDNDWVGIPGLAEAYLLFNADESFEDKIVSGTFKLKSGKNYEPLSRNLDSSYDITRGYVQIKKAVVHP